MLEVALNGATGLRRADVADYVKVVLGPLLLKLADTNQRVKQTARDALMLLAQVRFNSILIQFQFNFNSI